jgi:broad specificity phosphatase PhoE
MKIYFIRHAQGEHNLSEKNWQIKYPKLTELGIRQSKNLGLLLKDVSMDLILVSPLRRTLQTSEIIFGKENNSVSIELVKEFIVNPCDLREPKSKISEEFPNVNFDLVDDNYNYNELESDNDIEIRCNKFYDYIKNLNFENIAVVTHGAFLMKFVTIYGSRLKIEDKKWFENCECRIGSI